MLHQPVLVSVGIATYNRPEGLRRTLECITKQTYENLEIIVSDNCSPTPASEAVAEEFAAQDSRIKFYKQEVNRGALFNFKFVLQQARGEYFMWAADDDEWNLEFIAACLAEIDGSTGAFTSFETHIRGSNQVIVTSLLPLGETRYAQAKNFISNPTPSQFYSLHKREDILWFTSHRIRNFDWFDCYFVLKNIIDRHGYVILPDKNYYVDGIDGDGYVFKPANPSSTRLFQYLPLLVRTQRLIYQSKDLGLLQKLSLSLSSCIFSINSFKHFEQRRNLYRLYSKVLDALLKTFLAWEKQLDSKLQ